VISETICELPGPFGNYKQELFSIDMLSKAAQSTATAAASTVSPDTSAATPRATRGRATPTPDKSRFGCDAYRTVRVVKLPFTHSGDALSSTNGITSTATTEDTAYCLPVDGETYPPDLVTTQRVWNTPPPDPYERVRYVWNGGSAGGGTANLRSCTPDDFVAPVPTPPFEGAIQMPDLRRMGENQAKDALAKLGITDVYVDYQTRERIPADFDRFVPYSVVSTIPSAGDWYVPGTTVVLGIRAPDGSAPAPTAAPSDQPQAPTTQPPPDQPQVPPPDQPQAPTAAPPTDTPITLPGPGIQPGIGGP
jgi:hypothetical protein